MCKISLSFRFRISLSDMTNYKSAFGQVCRIKNRQTFKSMPILNSAYHAVKYAELRIGILLKICRFVIRPYHDLVWYAELRIGILLKVCRFVIRHITQTDTETETELLRRHSSALHMFTCVSEALRSLHMRKAFQCCFSYVLPFEESLPQINSLTAI